MWSNLRNHGARGMGGPAPFAGARAPTYRSISGRSLGAAAPVNLSIQNPGYPDTAATPASTGIRTLSGSNRVEHGQVPAGKRRKKSSEPGTTTSSSRRSGAPVTAALGACGNSRPRIRAAWAEPPLRCRAARFMTCSPSRARASIRARKASPGSARISRIVSRKSSSAAPQTGQVPPAFHPAPQPGAAGRVTSEMTLSAGPAKLRGFPDCHQAAAHPSAA